MHIDLLPYVDVEGLVSHLLICQCLTTFLGISLKCLSTSRGSEIICSSVLSKDLRSGTPYRTCTLRVRFGEIERFLGESCGFSSSSSPNSEPELD